MSAAEFDVRLSVGTAAVADEIEVDGEGTVDLTDETSGSGSLTGHAFFGEGLIGFMVGGGFRAAVHAGDEDSPVSPFDLTYTGKALLLEAGVTIKPIPMWRIEVRPQFSVGVGEVEVDITGDNLEGDSGDYVAYGAVVGNYLRFGWFEVGVDLGYETFTGKSEIEGVETETTGEGLFAQLGLGVMF